MTGRGPQHKRHMSVLLTDAPGVRRCSRCRLWKKRAAFDYHVPPSERATHGHQKHEVETCKSCRLEMRIEATAAKKPTARAVTSTPATPELPGTPEPRACCFCREEGLPGPGPFVLADGRSACGRHLKERVKERRAEA